MPLLRLVSVMKLIDYRHAKEIRQLVANIAHPFPVGMSADVQT